MPKVFNKTGHGLTGIIITQSEIKSVLRSEFFYADLYIHLLNTRVEQKALHRGWGLCQKF